MKSKRYTPNHPEIIRLKEDLDQLLVQRQKMPKVKIYKTATPTARSNIVHPSIDYAAVLKAAVADGMLTEEYVEHKLAEYENAQYDEMEQKLVDAVEAGEITREDAAAQKAEYRELLNAMREKRQVELQQKR